jgi:hypothetical protein
MRRAAILVLLAAGLAGCGAAPFEYHSQNDIPRGPGMFSGADGAFVFRTKDSDEWREFQEWKRRKAAEERR